MGLSGLAAAVALRWLNVLTVLAREGWDVGRVTDVADMFYSTLGLFFLFRALTGLIAPFAASRTDPANGQDALYPVCHRAPLCGHGDRPLRRADRAIPYIGHRFSAMTSLDERQHPEGNEKDLRIGFFCPECSRYNEYVVSSTVQIHSCFSLRARIGKLSEPGGFGGRAGRSMSAL